MGEGKQGVMVVSKLSQNPMEQVQGKVKELQDGFQSWLAKQSLPVEAGVVTLTSAAQGAFMGVLLGTLTNDMSSALPTPPPQASLNPQAMASFQQAQVFLFSSFFTNLAIRFLEILLNFQLLLSS